MGACGGTAQTHSGHFNQPQTRRSSFGSAFLIKKIVETRGSVLLIALNDSKFGWKNSPKYPILDWKMSNLSLVETFARSPSKLKEVEQKLRHFDVDHCHEAFGFQITFESRERIVYSGDTRPCDSVIDNAFECDLLVHEATMSNDLIHEAIIRKHCTIEEAVDVGVRSKSRGLLLTHFSQRYAKEL